MKLTLSRLLKESTRFTLTHFKIFTMIMAIPIIASLVGFSLVEYVMTFTFSDIKKHMTIWLVIDLLIDAVLWNFVACMVYANWLEYYVHRKPTLILIPLEKRSLIFLKYSLLFSIPESFLILGIYIFFITSHMIAPPSEPVVSYLAHQSLQKEWILGGFLATIPYYYVITRLSFVFAATSLDRRATFSSAWKKMSPDHILVLKLSLILSMGSVMLDRFFLLLPLSSFWLYGEHVFRILLETLVFGILTIACIKLYERRDK